MDYLYKKTRVCVCKFIEVSIAQKSLPMDQFIKGTKMCKFMHTPGFCSPTCTALDGSNGGGSARGRAAPSDDCCDATLLLFLRAAFLYCAHVAVAPHAEAAGHGQVQGIHGLGLHLTKHRLTHRLNLPIHLHLAHLQEQKQTRLDIQHAYNEFN